MGKDAMQTLNASLVNVSYETRGKSVSLRHGCCIFKTSKPTCYKSILGKLVFIIYLISFWWKMFSKDKKMTYQQS